MRLVVAAIAPSTEKASAPAISPTVTVWKPLLVAEARQPDVVTCRQALLRRQRQAHVELTAHMTPGGVGPCSCAVSKMTRYWRIFRSRS